VELGTVLRAFDCSNRYEGGNYSRSAKNGAIQNSIGIVAAVANTSAIEFTLFPCRLERINAPWKRD
jgi:hypothetical protein